MAGRRFESCELVAAEGFSRALREQIEVVIFAVADVVSREQQRFDPEVVYYGSHAAPYRKYISTCASSETVGTFAV